MEIVSPATRTRIAARIIGPLLIAATGAIYMRYETLSLLVPAFFQDGPLVLITGVFTLIAGLTLFALHHHWTSPPAIVVSLLALATCVRGFLLMIAPAIASTLAAAVARTPPIALAAGVITLLLGLYLSFVGWFSKSN